MIEAKITMNKGKASLTFPVAVGAYVGTIEYADLQAAITAAAAYQVAQVTTTVANVGPLQFTATYRGGLEVRGTSPTLGQYPLLSGALDQIMAILDNADTIRATVEANRSKIAATFKDMKPAAPKGQDRPQGIKLEPVIVAKPIAAATV